MGPGIETISIEKDPAIAEVARYNGGIVITADILGVDPADFTSCFLTHFSPRCTKLSITRNSKAKQDVISRIDDLARHQRIVNGEDEMDIRFARKICEFIRVVKPEFFTLENVWLYRKSLSWLLIWYALMEEGYGVSAWNLNAADYGVPQSRRRMIVIARWWDGNQPAKPFPGHSRKPDMFTQPWNGWYEAIEDLIPDLPETQFAPWQEDRLPDELKTFLMMTCNTGRNGTDNKKARGCLRVDQPASTVVPVTNQGGAMPRAFLIPGDNTSNKTVKSGDEPMVTVQTRPPSKCPHRALILGQGKRSKPKAADLPADTVTANGNQTGVKALIIDSANSNSNDGKGNIRDGDEPVFTVTTNVKTAPAKALIMGGQKGLLWTNPNSPIWSICASDKLDTRIVAASRVVSITPRCLARFQDFPDSFVLPGEPGLADNLILLLNPMSDRELACRGIGNALPPGVYRAVLESWRA